MKILYVISYFTSKQSGNVNSCSHLYEYLAKRDGSMISIITDFKCDKTYEPKM